MSEEEIILGWKKEHGEVFGAEVDRYTFYFRLLTFHEYSTITKSSNDVLEADEMICRRCVLEPVIQDWSSEIFAGYTSTLARLIKEESLIISKTKGKDDVKNMIEEGTREIESSFMMQLPVIIAKAFPQYKLDELEAMTLRKQIELYIKASWAIKHFDDVDLEFVEDEEG